MIVKDAMVPRDQILTAEPKDTVFHAMETMVLNRIGSILIIDPTDENKVNGIVTAYDCMKTLVENKEDGFDIKLKTIMSTQIIAVNEKDKMENVYSLMEKNRKHHLVVRDNQGNLSGIISTFDIVREKSLDLEVHPWMGPDVFSLADR